MPDLEPPPSRDKLPSLTGLRAWAAAIVVLYHLGNKVGRIPLASYATQYGRTGVTLFFVLSGFVLTYTYLHAPTARRVFYWRRFARVWPLHITVLTVSALVLWAIGQPRDVADLLPAAVLLHSWVPVSAFDADTLGVSWSLSNEAFFYAVFPLLLIPLRRRAHRWLAWILGFLAVYAAWHLVAGLAFDGFTEKWAIDRLPAIRLLQFLSGVLVGAAFVNGRRAPVRLSVAVAAVVAWHLLLIPWGHFEPAGTPIPAQSASQAFSFPLFALLIWGAAQRDRDGRSTPLLASRTAVKLGHWSYALYLTHVMVIILWVRYIGRPDSVVETVLAWAVILVAAQALAAAAYSLLERPAEAWMRRRGPRNPTDKAPERAAAD
jgi:peptidoglycan/LPS O-acetylase OafA/YrhL